MNNMKQEMLKWAVMNLVETNASTVVKGLGHYQEKMDILDYMDNVIRAMKMNVQTEINLYVKGGFPPNEDIR